jgi:hypothetical protein
MNLFFWRNNKMNNHEQPNRPAEQVIKVSNTITPDLLAKFDQGVINQLVKKIAKTAVSRLKQELTADSEAGIEQSVKRFCSTVARKAWHKSQQWCKWNEGGPVLMPDFTRMYYKKGNTEIMVMEYAPQTRVLKFHGSLAKRNSILEEISDQVESKVYNYSLALPYTVFIHRFRNGLYEVTYVAFNDRPLKKLEEKPLRPYLSNIDNTLKLCSGLDFDRRQLVKDNLVQQAAFVMSHFWQTVYSNEWANHFWAYRYHFRQTDDRLKDLDSWQAASYDNPLFVIDGVHWLPHPENSFGDIIVKLFEGDDANAQFQQDLFNAVTEELLDDVVKSVKNAANGIEDKIDQMTPELQGQLMTELRKIFR